MRRRAFVVLAFWLAFVLAVGSAARADTAEDPRTVEARQLFMQGVELVKLAQWSEALTAFERSEHLRPHPLTTFNRGACHRALGRYTLARQTLRRALDEGQKTQSLPDSYATDARAFLQEIDRILAHVAVTVSPSGSTLVLDGRPLEPATEPAPMPVFLAGVHDPGPGAFVPEVPFEIVLDPGMHVFTFSRKGYADAVVSRTLAPGSHTPLSLQLDLLPATLHISSSVPAAIVTLDQRDLGPVPVDLLRPPGTYRVEVRKDGFEPYRATVSLNPGAETTLTAPLSEEHVSLTKRWWFWTGAFAIVSAGAITTYALTRPTPPPQPYDGGNTGWVLSPPTK